MSIQYMYQKHAYTLHIGYNFVGKEEFADGGGKEIFYRCKFISNIL